MRGNAYRRFASATALAAACGSPGGPDEQPIPPDDRGTLVDFGQPLSSASTVWSADGREIFVFTRRASGSPAPYTLRGYDPATQARRVVGEASEYPQSFRGSATDQWLYYVTLVGPEPRIFRVSQQGGNAEHLDAGGAQPGVAISEDDRYVAYVPARGTVAVFDTQDGSRRDFTVPEASTPIAFGPTGIEIAISSTFPGGSAVDILDRGTGTARRVHTRQDPSAGSPGSPPPAGAAWKGGVLHLLLATASETGRSATFRERNVATGTETTLGTITPTATTSGAQVSWAAAASTVAVLVPESCLRPGASFFDPCLLRRYGMFTVSGGQGALVGTANMAEFGWISLSPDARWVAVGAPDGNMSVKPLTP